MPAVWTTPRTWTNGEIPDATDMNEHIRDNFMYLLSRETAVATLTSDITTTSTSYADMTGATVTITLAGTKALLVFDAVMQAWPGSNIGNSFSIKVLQNSSDVKERTYPGKGSINEGSSSLELVTVSFAQLITGLTPGSNTFKLQWKHNDGGGSGTVKLYGSTRGAQMFAVEV